MKRMSQLLRSSPSSGSTSYGALPSHDPGADSETSTASPVAADSQYRDAPRTSPSTDSDGVRRREPSRQSRASGSQQARKHLREEVAEGELESGLETRFITGNAQPSACIPLSQDDTLVSDEEEPRSYATSRSPSAKSRASDNPADNSPYAQVRASVPATDDLTLSINTPRMWILSLFFAVLGSSSNLFFSLRYPSVSISPIIALLLVHPLGLLWDCTLKRHDDPSEIFIDGTLHKRNERHGENGASESVPFLSSPTRQSSGPQTSPRWTRRLRLWLAQGQWNEKEHCCVFISSNVSFGFAFATDVIVEQTMFYGQKVTITYQILLTISTQVLGYAIAGVTRRFLVRPSGMIWPSTLMSASMFNTLHKEENKPADGWTISRSKLFVRVFAGSVAFYFLPGLLMPALSYFNVVTWLAPDNVIIANLFGVVSGLGMFPVTFDWAQIAYIGSPLVVPLWAAANIVAGLVLFMWLLAPIMYYSNVMYTAYLPMLSANVYDNRGEVYDVTRILTPDFLLDEEAYRRYSRVFLPVTYVLSYALQFAALTALLTHTICWHGKDMWRQWKKSLDEMRSQSHQRRPSSHRLSDHSVSPTGRSGSRSRSSHRSDSRSAASEPDTTRLLTSEDVHNRLMRRYRDVPISWYLITGLLMTLAALYLITSYPTYLPVSGLLLSLLIPTLLFIPIGIIMALTNQQTSLYLICQLTAGTLYPGKPIANMLFATYGYISSTQGLKFASDLKLGHYMKIPPRTLFHLQLASTILSSLTQIALLNWMLTHIPNICTPDAPSGFTCPLARVHFNGSILWGLLSPSRFFSRGASSSSASSNEPPSAADPALYRPLLLAFPLGLLLPLPLYLLTRNASPSSPLRRIHLPILLGSLSWIPPATGLNFAAWALVCYLFNGYIANRRSGSGSIGREWWSKYTMTVSAALDGGLAVGVAVVFFGVVYPAWGWVGNIRWWGTEVWREGCDYRGCSWVGLGEGERFGPGTWW